MPLFRSNVRARGGRHHYVHHHHISSKQSVAVVGSGAVGCYYGARLWESGDYDVSFHMRGEHYAKSVENGLNVTSIDGDIFIPADKLKAHEVTTEMGTADWVVVCLKSSSLDAIPELVAPLLDENTRVLVIMNGLVEVDLIDAMNQDAKARGKDSVLDECAAIYGGMALICSNRLGPGRVDHSYAGLLSAGVGISKGTPEEDKEAFMKLWKPTNVQVSYEDSLLRGRWRKCVWNLPFNGISTAMGGITVDVIVNDQGLRRLADIVMDETVAAANADLASHGMPESAFLGDEDVSWFPCINVCLRRVVLLLITPTSQPFAKWQKRAMMQLSDSMGAYKTSTMIDLTQRKPMEVHYLFRKPVQAGKRTWHSSTASGDSRHTNRGYATHV